MSRPPRNEMQNRNVVNNGLIDFQDNNMAALAAFGNGAANPNATNTTPLMMYTTDPATGLATAVNVYNPAAAVATAAGASTASPATAYIIASPNGGMLGQAAAAGTLYPGAVMNTAVAAAAAAPAGPMPVAAQVQGAGPTVYSHGMGAAAMTQASLNGAVVMGPPSEVHVNGKVYRMVADNEKLAAPAAEAVKKPAAVASSAGGATARTASKKTLSETIQDRVDKRVQEFMSKTQPRQTAMSSPMRLSSSAAAAAPKRPVSASVAASAAPAEPTVSMRELDAMFKQQIKALEAAAAASSAGASKKPESSPAVSMGKPASADRRELEAAFRQHLKDLEAASDGKTTTAAAGRRSNKRA